MNKYELHTKKETPYRDTFIREGYEATTFGNLGSNAFCQL